MGIVEKSSPQVESSTTTKSIPMPEKFIMVMFWPLKNISSQACRKLILISDYVDSTPMGG